MIDTGAPTSAPHDGDGHRRDDPRASGGRLYVVATPIGNLGDIGQRAIDTLRKSAWIAVEDSRVSRVLLERLGIAARLLSAHEHNELAASTQLIARLGAGEDASLITDAGTPAISDPGGRIVDAVRAAGFEVVPIPGPSAPVALLSVAGFEPAPFLFEGFLPPKEKARDDRLTRLARECDALGAHLVLFESPHRIERTLAAIEQAFGPARELAIGRELTKKFEQIHRCRTGDAMSWLKARTDHARGEFVLAIAARTRSQHAHPPEGSTSAGQLPPAAELLSLLMTELPVSRAVRIAQALSGLGHRELYAMALELKPQDGAS